MFQALSVTPKIHYILQNVQLPGILGQEVPAQEVPLCSDTKRHHTPVPEFSQHRPEVLFLLTMREIDTIKNRDFLV